MTVDHGAKRKNGESVTDLPQRCQSTIFSVDF